MPRFVLLKHTTPPGYERPSHWDFMLEHDGVLWTWAVLESPAVLLAQNRVAHLAAELLADHRLAYLDYEGPVSRNRGSVERVWNGTYAWRTDAQCDNAEVQLTVESGYEVLVRIRTAGGGSFLEFENLRQ